LIKDLPDVVGGACSEQRGPVGPGVVGHQPFDAGDAVGGEGGDGADAGLLPLNDQLASVARHAGITVGHESLLVDVQPSTSHTPHFIHCTDPQACLLRDDGVESNTCSNDPRGQMR
jgi:hypothetical protein